MVFKNLIYEKEYVFVKKTDLFNNNVLYSYMNIKVLLRILHVCVIVKLF